MDGNGTADKQKTDMLTKTIIKNWHKYYKTNKCSRQKHIQITGKLQKQRLNSIYHTSVNGCCSGITLQYTYTSGA